MKIYKSNGTLLLEVDVDDTSYRSRQIMGDNCVVLKFALAEYTEIPVGSYIDYGNIRYTILKPHDVKMQHSRNYEYSVTFHTDAERAKTWIFKNPVDGRISFSLAATPREHLQMFVENMNRRDSEWAIGECISGEEKLISYDRLYCSDALALMASELNTEYEFIGKTVSLKKVEYNRDNPLALSYGGTGNGFKAGISRSNGNGDLPLEILYVQGGEQNIDYSKYRSRTLLLPKGQTIKYDGDKFEDETGYDAGKARTYIVSADGDYIQRQDKALSSMTEASLDLSDIYPSRVGTVKEVITVDAENNFYDFTDLNAASDPCPNYEDCRIGEEQMTVIFQTGDLAGREFDVEYHHDSETVRGVTKLPRRFEIVPADIDGETMPNATFKPAAGDKYIVFHCQLPDDYIRKDSSKSGASWRMFREAVRYMYDNEDYKFTFNGTLDGIWAKNDWVNIGAKIKLGGYISFTDSHFQPEPVLIRITDVKDYINNPHAPEITVSNETVSAGFGSAIRKIEGGKTELETKIGGVTRYTKRGFRDAKETSKMLEEAMIEGFTQSISPITAQMMQLIVGDERLQYRFKASLSSTEEITPSFIYNGGTGFFRITNPDGGEYVMQHLSLGVTTLKNNHTAAEYYYWGVKDNQEFAVGSSPGQSYYVYIECPKYTKGASESSRRSAGTYYAKFILSATPKQSEESGKYYFLTGTLASEYDGDRSFAQLYGFTEITGGRITTDRIVSNSGKTYFDLAQGVIGGTIKFASTSGGERDVSELEGDISDVDDKADSAKSTADSAKSTADSAKSTAAAAQTAAAAAQTAAAAATTRLTNWASDGYVSPTEKLALKNEWESVKQIYAETMSRADKYTVATSVYTTAYNNAVSAFTKYTQSSPENIQIVTDYADIKAFYAANTTICNTIATKVKEATDAAASAAAAAETNSKNEVAKKLGYNSWNDMVAKAEAGKTIISGGLIRTELINTDTLIVKRVASKDNKFYFKEDGTMVAVNGNFSGTINATSGSITGLTTKRLRNPFTKVEDSFSAINDDTVYTYIPTSGSIKTPPGSSMYTVAKLDWTVNSSGRRIVLVAGSSTISAPSGKCFYENGYRFNALNASKDCVELLGFGTGSSFYGWIVLSRNLIDTNYSFGRKLTPLAIGKVTGTNESATLSKYKTFDGSEMSVSRTGEGKYTLILNGKHFAGTDCVYVDLTGYGYAYGADSPIKATVTGIYVTTAVTYIYIETSDDESRNDGSFFFKIYNMAQWDD